MDELTFTGKCSTQELARMPNVAAQMDEEDLKLFGLEVKNSFEACDATRARWKEWYARALKLAMQISEAKNYPWSGASNVKFPLLTVSAMGYHARAYPALIPDRHVVSCAVIGVDDADGTRKQRADRVSAHMSYQLMEDTEWERVTDASLLAQPILGTTFKKFWFDPVERRKKVKLVYAENLVVDYMTTSMDKAQAITELYDFSGNDIYERIQRGIWIDPYKDEEPPPPQRPPQSAIDAVRERSQKISPPPATDYDVDAYPFAEHYCYYDFDGDGYKEPYVVYFRRDTGTIYRIVSRFYEDDIEWVGTGRDRRVLRIASDVPYVKKGFISSPDGGFYDLGFGALLGPINESVDTSINQMFDAAHLKTLGGGFLGRGVRVKGGEIQLRMNGWVRVDSTGDDLRKNIVPHTMPEPSDVLFKLMVFLIEYAQRIASANDVQMGENPGQNTPAETMRTMSENGRLIFNALFKREWNSTTDEFRKFYDLNRRHPFDQTDREKTVADWFKIQREDYYGDAAGIYPSADPTVSSSMDKQMQTALMMKLAPLGGHDIYQVLKRAYENSDTPDIEQILPDPKGPRAIPAQPNAKLIEAQAKAKEAETKAMREGHRALYEKGKTLDLQNKYRLAVAKALDEHALNNANIAKIGAEMTLLRAQAGTETNAALISKYELELKSIEQHNSSLLEAIDILNGLTGGADDAGNGGSPDTGGMAGMDAGPEVSGAPPDAQAPPGGDQGGVGAQSLSGQ